MACRPGVASGGVDRRPGAIADVGAEGHEGELGDLEALAAKGQADDREGEDDAAEGSAQGDFPAEEDDPQEIDEKGDRAAAVFDVLAEGQEGELGDLEALQAGGDEDDGAAEEEAAEDPGEAEPQAAEDEPEEVAEGGQGCLGGGERREGRSAGKRGTTGRRASLKERGSAVKLSRAAVATRFAGRPRGMCRGLLPFGGDGPMERRHARCPDIVLSFSLRFDRLFESGGQGCR